MCVEPGGPTFETTLVGEITPRIPAIVPSQPNPAHQILSNRTFLSWGGVNVGRAAQQTLVLKSSFPYALRVQMRIRGSGSGAQRISCHDFRLQGTGPHGACLSDVKDAVLSPHAELPVHVFFLPARIADFKASLTVESVNNEFRKYKVPLGLGCWKCTKGDCSL